MDEGVVEIIKETAVGIQERYAIEFEALGMDRDHIHILCSAHPKIAPGEIVRIFKSITAREVFKRKPEIKKELWGGEFWTDGYLCGDGRREGRLENSRKICEEAGQAERRNEAVEII